MAKPLAAGDGWVRPGRIIISSSPARGAGQAWGLFRTLMLLIVLFLSFTSLAHAVPPGTTIDNAARATFRIFGVDGSVLSNNARLVTTRPHTAAGIELLQYAPAAPGAETLLVPATVFDPDGTVGGATQQVAAVHPAGSAAPIDLSAPVPLVNSALYHQGEPIFIRVRDGDQNLDPVSAERIWVLVGVAGSADSELLLLTETGPNTGIFAGYIQSNGRGPLQAFNGVLDVTEGQTIEARYTDIGDSADSVTVLAAVDPYGLVFNSSNGQAVEGVELTLIDNATGQPARVFGDDGVSAFPATITSGGTVNDAGGKVYAFAAGSYRFPFVAPGTYRLIIRPPAGFRAPSTVSTSALQELPGAPFVIAEPGSRGEAFVLNPGPAVRMDIPVDSAQNGLWVRKRANRTKAAVGDFVQYSVTVENSTAGTVTGLNVTDHLPRGFRYRSASAKMEHGRLGDPAISADGRTLVFSLGELAEGRSAKIEYVVEIAAGTKSGKARNRAQAAADGGLRSNTAEALVTVTEDLFRSESFIVGRVIADNCNDLPTERADGVKGVRIYLEDGTYVITDEQGMYHFEGVKPGTHVVQIDLASLPAEYQVVDCRPSTRTAGTPYSTFVELQGGTLWRVDFHLLSTSPAGEAQSPSPRNAEMKEDRSGSEEDAPRQDLDRIDPDKLLPGFAWVEPAENFYPYLPSVKLAVQHGPNQKIDMLLGDQPLSALSFDGVRRNTAGNIAVSRFVGIGIVPGENRFTAILRDRSGNEIGRLTRVIRYTGQPMTAEVVAEASSDVANGKDTPVIAVRLLDKDGYPARYGIFGEYSVLEPHEAFTPAKEVKQGRLVRSIQDKPRYKIGPDGMVRIKLQPTTQSGWATIRFHMEGQDLDVRLWLKPQGREWILVGLAEGTAGYNSVTGNMENLSAADQEENYYQDGRLAFFAKGKIKGDWLVTAAYDSAREQYDSATRLFQTLDPNTYYTLYGDGTAQQHEASSIRKLYLKVERERFYAMFGDYRTGLDVTELSRYSRRFNGLKTEYNGEQVGVTAFATQSGQAFMKDEIRGDGTSGLYRLSRGSIVVNSEKIVIETRDRFRSEMIISSRPQSRFIDYSIDYTDGTLFFKSPVYSRDPNLNPIYIVAEYETDGGDDDAYTCGGRGSVKLLENKAEIGATVVHEGPTDAKADLAGIDAKIDLGHGLTLKAETAGTRRELGGDTLKGQAHLAELSRRSDNMDAKIYYRELGEDFGLEQQNGSERETRKMGADAAWRLGERWALSAELYRQYNLATEAERDLAEGRLHYNESLYQIFTGLRKVEERYEDKGDRESTQLLLGVARQFFDNRLRLRATREQSLFGQNESLDFPTRTILGADYQVTDPLALFVEHEWADGDTYSSQTTRAGIKSTPWQGGEIGTSLGRRFHENGDRLFANLGLHQIWQIDQNWFVDGGVDRTETVHQEGSRSFNTNVPAASGDSEDFTAVALGGGYKEELWSSVLRFETRRAEHSDKWILVSGIAGEVRRGLGLSAGVKLIDSTTEMGTETFDADIRLGMAYRPKNTAWIVLDRLDFKIEDQKEDSEGSSDSRRIVNNLNLNYQRGRVQVALQYGAKYVFDTIDGECYTGYTDLTGLELRYDLSSQWDVGLHGGALHSWEPGTMEYRTGISIGYSLFKNTWLSVGYNFTGFEDEDFSAADFTAAGPFVKFRLKFDQQSVKEMVDWFAK
jgi:uncharacterized repeat protein (TIGR01451 family)